MSVVEAEPVLALRCRWTLHAGDGMIVGAVLEPGEGGAPMVPTGAALRALRRAGDPVLVEAPAAALLPVPDGLDPVLAALAPLVAAVAAQPVGEDEAALVRLLRGPMRGRAAAVPEGSPVDADRAVAAAFGLGAIGGAAAPLPDAALPQGEAVARALELLRRDPQRFAPAIARARRFDEDAPGAPVTPYVTAVLR